MILRSRRYALNSLAGAAFSRPNARLSRSPSAPSCSSGALTARQGIDRSDIAAPLRFWDKPQPDTARTIATPMSPRRRAPRESSLANRSCSDAFCSTASLATLTTTSAITHSYATATVGAYRRLSTWCHIVNDDWCCGQGVASIHFPILCSRSMRIPNSV